MWIQLVIPWGSKCPEEGQDSWEGVWGLLLPWLFLNFHGIGLHGPCRTMLSVYKFQATFVRHCGRIHGGTSGFSISTTEKMNNTKVLCQAIMNAWNAWKPAVYICSQVHWDNRGHRKWNRSFEEHDVGIHYT